MVSFSESMGSMSYKAAIKLHFCQKMVNRLHSLTFKKMLVLPCYFSLLTKILIILRVRKFQLLKTELQPTNRENFDIDNQSAKEAS